MPYKMTEEYKKILTEMIGECFHEKLGLDMPHSILIQDDRFGGRYQINEYKCHKCGKNFTLKDIRTFITDPDMMKVFRWLVVNGKYDVFDTFTWQVRNGDNARVHHNVWLFYDTERFCCLAAMAKKENII